MIEDYVLDASVLVLALVGRTDSADGLRQRLPTMGRHAPHLTHAEVGNVLQRHEQRGLISPEEACSALDAASVLFQHRHPQQGEVRSQPGPGT